MNTTRFTDLATACGEDRDAAEADAFLHKDGETLFFTDVDLETGVAYTYNVDHGELTADDLPDEE